MRILLNGINWAAYYLTHTVSIQYTLIFERACGARTHLEIVDGADVQYFVQRFLFTLSEHQIVR